MLKDIEILECTLRDGGYTIEHQFTKKDTALISTALQNVGFKYIEIGHGLGLNASSLNGTAAETDEVYLRTAKEMLNKSFYGMFFIPGIGRKKDLDLASKYDMHFVRIGTNVTEVEQAKEYIEYAKDLGMLVTSNLMKSYALPPDKFAKKAMLVEKFGADIIYIVDSSGGMLPKDVEKYIKSMKKNQINTKIGFHGHNNFSLAIANTLTSIEHGATFVDSSLLGIGRSAGNTQTEILVTILEKMGLKTDIDVFKTMDIAQELIGPLMKAQKGSDPISITSALADFHSKFLDTVYRSSKKYSIDPRKLIISVSKKDKIYVSDEVADEFARQIQNERAALSDISRIDVNKKNNISDKRWDGGLSTRTQAELISHNIQNISIKNGKQSIFIINISALFKNLNIVLPYIYETSSYIMGLSEMKDIKNIIDLLETIDGVVDFIVVDEEKKKKDLNDLIKLAMEHTKRSTVLTYKGNHVWVQSIDSAISNIYKNIYSIKIGIVGANNSSIKLALFLSERGAQVYIDDKNKEDRSILNALNKIRLQDSPFKIKKIDLKDTDMHVDILIGMDTKQKINVKMVRNIKNGGAIIDAAYGALDKDAIELAHKQDVNVFRIDLKASIAGEMTTILRTNNLMAETGRTTMAGVPIISSTVLGNKGDIIVDSIIKPNRVIGMADGEGHIMYDCHDEKIDEIEMEIIKRKIEGK